MNDEFLKLEGIRRQLTDIIGDIDTLLESVGDDAEAPVVASSKTADNLKL